MLEQAADKCADARIALRLVRCRCGSGRCGRRLLLCGRSRSRSFRNGLGLLIRRLILHADDRGAGADAEETGLGALHDLNGNIIPVKAKWLAWIDAAYFALAVLQYLLTGHFLYALIPIVAVLNYLLFFAADIGSQFSYWKGRAKNRARQNQYRQAYNHPGSGPKVVNFHDAKTKTKTQYLHKCAVCGKTDLTDPQMEFRYCSRCNGYYCYCADHINNHIHIQ